MDIILNILVLKCKIYYSYLETLCFLRCLRLSDNLRVFLKFFRDAFSINEIFKVCSDVFNILIKMETIHFWSHHSPPPCHPLAEPKEIYLLSSHVAEYVFMHDCSKPFKYKWTENTGIFLIMQAGFHIQILKESTEQLHSIFFLLAWIGPLISILKWKWLELFTKF